MSAVQRLADKLQGESALVRLTRVISDGVDNVATQKGVERYGLPIGAPIGKARKGSGAALQEKAQARAEEWWKKGPRTAAKKRWLYYQYSGHEHDYQKQQAVLRRQGKEKADQRALRAAWVKVFDEAGVEAEEDVTLYRGLLRTQRRSEWSGDDSMPFSERKLEEVPAPEWAEVLQPGVMYVEDGVTSTTASVGAARGWLSRLQYVQEGEGSEVKKGHVLLEINVPKGTRVVGGEDSGFETMLAPGTTYKVLRHERKQIKPFDHEVDVIVVEVVR